MLRWKDELFPLVIFPDFFYVQIRSTTTCVTPSNLTDPTPPLGLSPRTPLRCQRCDWGRFDWYRRRGRFFYRMVEGSTPQWILTHPMAKAPRAGDGLFPGEVIEVTQVSPETHVPVYRFLAILCDVGDK